MQYRELGATGIRVSAVGFGAWGIGGRTAGETSYGETDDSVSLAALSCALDHGITLYDTSPAYGDGHSEELIGKAFHNKRDQVVIASKLGIQSWTSDPDYSIASIQTSIEESLRRLKTSYIDVIQFHNVPLDYLLRTPDVTPYLDNLVEEGVVRSWGMSLNNPAEGFEALRVHAPKSIQVNINMLDMRAVSSGLMELAEDMNVGVIARTPLCFGFLTQTLQKGATYPLGDHRNAWSQEQIARWLDGADMMFDVIEKSTPGEVAAQTALRFCLSVSGVSSVIPGLLTPEEVQASAAVGDMAGIDATELSQIIDINQKIDFFIPKSK